MKNNNTLLIITSVVAGTVLYLFRKSRDDAFGWSKNKIAEDREQAKKDIFNEMTETGKKVTAIRDAEKTELFRMKSSIQAMYEEVKQETEKIEANERTIVAAQDAQYEKNIRQLTNKSDCITTKEQSMLHDIFKADEVLQSLKTAKKALKKADKDTSEIEKKISDRKSKLEKDILNSRTDEEKEVFKRLAMNKKEYADRTSRSEEIKKARTVLEKSMFDKKAELYRDLSDDTGRKAIIQQNRSAEDQAVLDRYKDVSAKAYDICAKESESISDNFDEWLGRYFAEELGMNKVSVICIGMLPLVPVGILVGRYVNYILNISRHVKKGE